MSSQLQVTGEAKIRDIQGPVVANSGVITALDGAASQYVRGDGTLADFPTSSGGGSSVSYYLNSSVSQGTIGGVAYRELSKDPIIGAGTDIAISTTGYVASYITDANDPDVTLVPGGNFNCEFYFSVNNNSGNPTTYAELYKYDGTTFTLLGSNVGVPESINQGTTIAPYYFAIPVATAALALTDRLAIRIYVNVDGRTVTLHTENGHLCQVVTTLSKGMVSLNNLTDQSQFITTGTAGTNFTIASSGDTHTFNLPVASAANTGKLSSTDWSTFNNKQAALSFTAPLVNTSNTISIPVATASVDGYLDNADWTNFNTAYNNMIVSAAVTGTTTKTLTLTQQDAGTITASWTDDNTDAVTSVFGRTGAVVATEGDYSLTQLSDVTITTPSSGQVLKYNGTAWINDTDANTGTVTSVAMSVPTGLSVSGSPITSSGTLAVSLASGYSIPTTAKQTEWDTAYTNRITSASFPLSISSNAISISLASASTAGYLSIADWNIFNSKQNALTNPVTGTGNSGYVSIFTGTSAIGNSIIFQSTTRIGILTATPSTTLDVNGGGNFSGSIGALSFVKSGGTSAQILAADGSVITAGTNITISGGTISASGVVTGTGTTNYLPKFTGASTIGNSAITDDGTTVTLVSRALSGTSAVFSGSVGVGATTSGSDFRYYPVSSASGNSVLVLKDDGADGTLDICSEIIGNANAASSPITFRVSSVAGGRFEAMRITNTGNLGLGVTPSAWGSPFVVSQYPYGSYFGGTTTGGTVMGNNNYYNGSNYIYQNSDYATQYQQASGGHLWRISPSGTAGNAISFTQAMTLDASGNLGLGATSPYNKLTIQGSSARMDLNDGGGASRKALIIEPLGYNSNAYARIESYNYGTATGGNLVINTTGGNVGIGTSAPARTLHILGASGIGTVLKLEGASGTTTYLQLSYNGATNAQSGYIGYNSSSNMSFFTNDTERMRITSGGNVLIGTTTDAGYKLDVNGTGRFSGAVTIGASSLITGSDRILELRGPGSNNSALLRYSDGATAKYSVGFNNNEYIIFDDVAGVRRLQIASTGAATFSSSVEARKLYVSPGGGAGSGSDGIANIQTTSSTLGETSELGLLIKNNGTSGYYSQIGFGYAESKVGAVIAGLITNGGGATSSALIFATRSTTTGSDAPTERLRITNGGNVGIGTASPSAKLMVYGTGDLSYVYNSGASTTDANFYIYNSTTDIFMVRNSGKVGIGTSNPSSKLSIGGTQGSTISSNVALLIGNSGAAASVGNLIQLGLHYNPDGATPASVIGAVLTSTAGFTKSDIFFATRDVTTDTAATERMRITSGGNVGIGTSSPQSKLHVYGGDILLSYNNNTIYSEFAQNASGGAINLKNAAGVSNSILRAYDNTQLNTNVGNVLIGTTTDAGQKLQVNGITKTNGISLAKTSFSSSTTMTDAFFSWSFGGAIGQTLTLYSSSGHNNMHFIKNESSVSLTIAAHSGGVIMGLTSGTGSSSITLGAFKTVQIISFGGGAWYIMYQTT